MQQKQMAEDRIIPAYAGSTSVGCPPTCTPADHPRIRGEHLQDRPLWGRIPGSSPHTRGARVRGERERHIVRIIPAYAGSTGVGGHGFPFDRDHPRIRGEHASAFVSPPTDCGSSPHTRGARFNARVLSSRATDHPRIRGEHGLVGGDDPSGRGSSPHTRGAPTSWGRPTRWPRIIPAYAGSTSTCWESI